MHATGWFTDKMNLILDNSPFGENAARIFKTMDILIRRYNVKVSECYVDLARGLIVYTVDTVVDSNGIEPEYLDPKITPAVRGQIVFEGIPEISNE